MKRRIFFITGIVAGILLLAGFFYVIVQQEKTSVIAIPRGAGEKSSYHSSQFFRYASSIEQTLAEKNIVEPLSGVQHIIGGIVPHHIPTAIPLLAEFYQKLKKTRTVKTFIIIGPDHIDRGKGVVTVSRGAFVTPFGTAALDQERIDQLLASGFVTLDESPFDLEHSIDVQLLFVRKTFPEARIVPLLVRSDMTNREAKIFGGKLAMLLNEETFLVASLDFSHYLAREHARPIDELSRSIVASGDASATDLAHVDSPGALTVFLAAMKAKGATDSFNLQTRNSADFTPNSDWTTGYVTGFFGIKKESVDEATLLFVGDIMLSRAIGEHMQKRGDWRYPFLKIGDFLKSADLTFGNLEGPISMNGKPERTLNIFRANPLAIEGLRYAGIDLVSIANNHIWDYGREAFLETLRLLDRAHLGTVGGGQNYDEAHRAFVREVKGTRIGFLAYTQLIARRLTTRIAHPAIAFLDRAEIITDVKRAKEETDLIVVSFHWGNEYETHRTDEQAVLAHAAIDAGASLVIGHHPHVVQEVEEYHGGTIAYSLGNFIFDQNFSQDTREGLMLRAVLQKKKLVRTEPVRIRFTPTFQPYILSEEDEKRP